MVLSIQNLLVWYSTTNLRFVRSSPYVLHAVPARVRSAVSDESVFTMFEAVYPGQSTNSARFSDRDLRGAGAAEVKLQPITIKRRGSTSMMGKHDFSSRWVL
jgi:hypothetical protein